MTRKSQPQHTAKIVDLAQNLCRLIAKFEDAEWGPNGQVRSRTSLSIMQAWSEAPHGMIG